MYCKGLEREPLRYCKGDGKVTFIRPFLMLGKVTFDTNILESHRKGNISSGWGNEDKQNTAPLNKPYFDTNTALFTSFTLSMHVLAISLWLSHIIDVSGECKCDAWVIN